MCIQPLPWPGNGDYLETPLSHLMPNVGENHPNFMPGIPRYPNMPGQLWLVEHMSKRPPTTPTHDEPASVTYMPHAHVMSNENKSPIKKGTCPRTGQCNLHAHVMTNKNKSPIEKETVNAVKVQRPPTGYSHCHVHTSHHSAADHPDSP